MRTPPLGPSVELLGLRSAWKCAEITCGDACEHNHLGLRWSYEPHEGVPK